MDEDEEKGKGGLCYGRFEEEEEEEEEEKELPKQRGMSYQVVLCCVLFVVLFYVGLMR